jgi:pyridoxamine 5'-phosphate oxidase
MSEDPVALFQALFAEAKTRESFDATACALATATRDAAPSVRIVLLNDAGPAGFTFFTNDGSRKGHELDANPQAALAFHWPVLGVQVRVEGRTERVSKEESEAYFATRPRESQLGAWASAQSAPLTSRDELLAKYRERELAFEGTAVPCPPHWGGYRLTPLRLEIWRAREFRLHERVVYLRTDSGWDCRALYP